MAYIFQHICHAEITREDMQLARRALTEPDVVSAETDTILGKATTWDSQTMEVRLCGRPGQTALLAVALFAPDGKLKTYRNSDKYETGFEFTHQGIEYILCLVPKDEPQR